MKRTVSLIAAVVFLLSFVVTSAAAEVFTPSATAGDAPDLVPVNLPDKKGVVAVIYNDLDGSVVRYVYADELWVVGYPERNDASDKTRVALEIAYDAVTGAGSLGDLIPGLGDVNPDVKSDEYAVTKLFEIEVIDDVLNKLNESEHYYLQLTLDTKLENASKVPTMAYNCGDGWKINDAKNLSYSGGSLTVKNYELCTILFLVPDDGSLLVTDPDITSPGTMEQADSFKVGTIIAVTAAVVLAGGAAFVLTSKKRNA